MGVEEFRFEIDIKMTDKKTNHISKYHGIFKDKMGLKCSLNNGEKYLGDVMENNEVRKRLKEIVMQFSACAPQKTIYDLIAGLHNELVEDMKLQYNK